MTHTYPDGVPMKDEHLAVSKEPQGVIAIVTSPDGAVIATAADFERQGMGGYELWEAQRMRAEHQVKLATVSAYCSNAIANITTGYLADQIFQALRKNGHRLVFRTIGWPDEVARETAERSR